MELTTSTGAAKIIDLGGLGQLEAVPEEGKWPEPARFPWFGSEIKVNPAASDVAFVDLLESSGELDENDPQAAVAVKTFVREIIHPDDFAEFWKLGKANGYSMSEMAQVAVKIIEAITETPTGQSSDSAPGLSGIAEKSTAASYKKVRSELEAEGRADLAEFYLLAEEAGVAT